MPIRAASRRRLRAAAVALGLTSGLAACGSLPLTTALSLARVDLLSVDPAGIRAAIRLPTDIDLPPGGAILTISAHVAGDAADTARSFTLINAGDREATGLARYEKPGFTIRAYRLSETDAVALAAFRDDVMRRAAGRKGNTLALSVGAKACRASGSGADPVPVATYLQLAPGNGYVVLTRETDLGAIQPLAGLAPCA